MRTTLDVDNDVLLAAKDYAQRTGVSVGKALSSLARQSLTPPETVEMRHGVPLFPIQPDARVVTSELIERLGDEVP